MDRKRISISLASRTAEKLQTTARFNGLRPADIIEHALHAYTPFRTLRNPKTDDRHNRR